MMEVMNVATMEYEFRHSVVSHNLENASGSLIDFTNPETYKSLDPRIGAEINGYIDDLNQELSDDELENFPIAPKPSFGDETTLISTSDES